MEHAGIRGKKFRAAFVLILVVAVSALFLAVTWPFLKPLLLGALLAGLFRPLYQWVTRRLGDRRSLGAVVTLLILFILVVGPISVFLGVVVQQALNISDQAIPWVRQHLGSASTFNAHDWLVQKFPALADHVPSQEELVQNVGAAAKGAGALLVARCFPNDGGNSCLSSRSFYYDLRDVFLLQGWRENPGADFLLHPAES